MSGIRLIITGDGSHSLLNAELDETYHSRHGAVQESEYVFIEQGLRYWLELSKQTQLNILEVGLGTALNAWLTFRLPEVQSLKLQYFAIEKFPLPEEVWQQLNYAEADRELFEKIHTVSWNGWQQSVVNSSEGHFACSNAFCMAVAKLTASLAQWKTKMNESPSVALS